MSLAVADVVILAGGLAGAITSGIAKITLLRVIVPNSVRCYTKSAATQKKLSRIRKRLKFQRIMSLAVADVVILAGGLAGAITSGIAIKALRT
jgi:preprotein translocase subunit YajC